jgi:hypothetical protein
MAKRRGAPARNANAQGAGLYVSNPERRVRVAATVDTLDMAGFAADLGSGALWIAENLAAKLDELELVEGRKLIGLYASVGQELAQLAAELEGETGIKPAALGQLSEARYEALMAKETRALELILNQCIGAWMHIKDREEIEQNGLIRTYEYTDDDGELVKVNEVNPVLNYLAGHMRVAKRIMREMAANLAWKNRGVEREDDLTVRLLNVIGERKE